MGSFNFVPIVEQWIEENSQARTIEQQARRILELEIENAVLWKAMAVSGKVYHFSDTGNRG